MPELVFLRRGEELLRIALDRSRTVLGRGETCDVVIPHPDVSAQQAAVLFDGHELVVEDLSGKGTVVSGARTSRASLPLGADIALGPWQAVLHAPGAPLESSWSCHGLGRVRIHSPPFLPASGCLAPALTADVPPAGPPTTAQPIIGADPTIRQLAHLIEWVASSPALVAIFGEAGSGRELVARAIHARSFRAERPFIRVNCRARDKETLAAELFGAPGEPDTEGASGSGAFTEARGGTLFLDEVGELSLEVQARFLRRVALREARPDGGRVVVATSQDLLSDTRAGLFREDLYDRLCLAPIVLAPLRRRPGDVPALAEHFVRCFSPRGQPVRLTAEALTRLSRYWWPGNLRELQNVIRRALLLRQGPRIEVSDLRFDAEASGEGLPTRREFVPGLTLDQMLRQEEREIVESALRRFDNNRERVARELGVARSTLFKRLKDWGLTRHGEPEPPPGVSPAA